ncbi:MAG: GWxTD domain-containing protein [Candidatus Aminicenantales bacterium]
MKSLNGRWRAAGVGLLFLMGLGLAACSQGPKIELDPDSEAFYETARLIMTKQEKQIFNHLPDRASREEFIQDFWLKRDPDPLTEENEYKEEFFRRIEYANDRFNEGTPGWKTDRGRIYIYFGEPDKIEQHPFLNEPDVKGVILWVYYRYGFGVYFIDRRGDGAYVLDPSPAEFGGGVFGSFFDALEMAKLGFAPQDPETARKFMDFDLKFDRAKGEILISIPVDALTFREEANRLQADFDFEFFVYPKNGPRADRIRESRHFEATESELLEMKAVVFAFSFELKPGKYIIDVIIIGREDSGKARKIFEIKV